MRERLSNNKKLITLLLDVWTEWGHSNHWGLWWDASGFKGHLAFLMAQRVKRLPVTHKTRVRSLGWEDPQRRKWQPTLVFLPGKSHGRRNMVGYSPWGCKRVRHDLATEQQKQYPYPKNLDRGPLSRKLSPYTTMVWTKYIDREKPSKVC